MTIIDFVSILVSMKSTTENDSLTTILQGVGLSGNESLVYLATLELGSASIWDIAQKSGVKRTTCYTVLEDLAVKGLASSTDDGRRVLYSVSSPKQLARLAESKYVKFISQIGSLEALSSRAPQKPKVQYFQGIEGIKQIYNLFLESPKGSEQCLVGSNLLVPDLYADFIDEFIKQRAKRGISTRAIFSDTSENRMVATRDKQDKRQTRFISKEKLNPNSQLYLTEDFFAYIAHSESEPFATFIESPSLVFDEKQRFEILWESARALGYES